jgi:hypothetical protein
VPVLIVLTMMLPRRAREPEPEAEPAAALVSQTA